MLGEWQPGGTYKILGRWTGIKHDPRDKRIPCGQCYGCRLDRSRQWADRMMIELDHSKTAIFVTLTYDQEHIQPCQLMDNGEWLYTLNKKDFQDFFKRLRYYFPEREIRYYLGTEYGPKTSRPHGHAVIYGLSLEDFVDRKVHGRNEFNQPFYESDFLNSIWQNGFTSLAPVSWQTCAYVARYCMKKQTGQAAEIYAINNQLPEFALMSRRPGISGYFALEHPDMLSDTKVFLSDPNGLKPRSSCSLPKYLFEKLSLTNPELYATLKEDKARFAEDRLLAELQNTDLSEIEYLEAKGRVAASRGRSLLRDKV